MVSTTRVSVLLTVVVILSMALAIVVRATADIYMCECLPTRSELGYISLTNM